MIVVGLFACAVSEALWDFMMAYSFAGYRFDAALILGEQKMAGNLHVAVLLIALLGTLALVVWLLRKRSSLQASSLTTQPMFQSCPG